jgi:predicted MFS family arabinose efflux permease
VLGLWSAYLPAGAGGIMIAASLLPADAGWRWLWYTAAAATLASATIMIATARRHRELLSNRLAPSVSFTGVREVLATPGVLLLGLCFALYAGAWYSVIGFLPVLQVERLEFDKSTAAFVTAVVVFSNVAGNVCAGWLLQHGVRRVLLLAGAASIMGASAAGLFLEVFPDGVRLALAFAFSMIGGLLPGCIFASVPWHCPCPALLGIAAGLVTQITNAGSLLGPPITGALVTRGGWPAAVWLTTGAFLLVIAASVLLHRIERHQDEHGIVAGGS